MMILQGLMQKLSLLSFSVIDSSRALYLWHPLIVVGRQPWFVGRIVLNTRGIFLECEGLTIKDAF